MVKVVMGREGRPHSRVYDDPANVAWRLHGVGARCGQDAKRLGIHFRYAAAFVVMISPTL